MRHRKTGRKFGRQSGPRHALLNGLVTNLVRYERIQTTDAKAKELRRYVERAITWGTKVAELVDREPESLAEHERARIVHAMRMARRTVRDREVLHKLFHEVGPRFLGRPGGYTRIIKIGHRQGDAARVSYIELLPAAGEAAPATSPEPAGKGKGRAKPEAEEGETKKAKPRAKAKDPHAGHAHAATPKAKKSSTGAKSE